MVKPNALVLQGLFEVKDRSFLDYMGASHGPSRVPGDYLQLAEAMGRQSHPLLQYAAGWAAMEAAYYRPRPRSGNRISLEQRLSSIEFAQAHWLEAGAEFFEREQTVEGERRKATYYSFGLRTINALNNLPVLRLACRLQANQVLPESEIQFGIKQSRSAQLETAIQTLGTTVSLDKAKRRSGLNNEIIAQLLLHETVASTHHLIVPSSLRADNHQIANMRADLVGHDLHGRHRRTLIQVSQTEKEGLIPNMFTVTANDLLLPGSDRPLDTLKALYNREMSELQPAVSQRLGSISVALGQRFNNHTAAV